MVMVIFVCLPLVLACGAVVAGRHGGIWPEIAPVLPPGEQVLAVIRPDAEVGLLLGALGSAGAGLALCLSGALFGPGALLPSAVILSLVALPVAAEWVGMLRRTWVLTDRRLIADHGPEVALDDLARLRILPLAVEVRTRGDRLLRLPALVNPGPAAQAIQSAARARQVATMGPIMDFPRRRRAL